MSQSSDSQSPDIKLGKLVTPVSLVVDAILVVGFFIYMFGVLKSHVPSNDFTQVFIWAGLTSACMSGVFWLAVQMFRVVLAAQLLAKKKQKH